MSRAFPQIAGELIACEVVEMLIRVERFDDPVAIRPHLSFVVEVQTVCVGVARDVEPVPRHFLAEARRREIAIHHFLVGIRRLVRSELRDFLRRRWQTSEREARAANECPAIRLRLPG